MQRGVLLLFWIGLVSTSCRALVFPTRSRAVNFPSTKASNFTGQDWALLIAGSAGYGNYRHQADVCHAYQVLKRGGLDDDHIVVMMADDLAQNYLNPHPGKLYNRPGGENVYEGVPLDYTGANVNAQTFLAVLSGDKESAKVLGTSGKVISSGPQDRVFVYFADHGAPGILGMPFGPFLYADQLHRTLRHKAANKGFADMVLYVEACESGSIFEGLLDDSLNIYVTTAANAHESSWGTYCPGMEPAPPSEFSTCLGDLYSVAFLENCDDTDLGKETLDKQYRLVKRRTSNNGSYLQGSHVMQYGALVIDEEEASDYLGEAAQTGSSRWMNKDTLQVQQSVPQRDADLLHLWTLYLQAAPGAAKAKALAGFNAEVGKRVSMDAAVRSLAQGLLSNATVLAMIQEQYKDSNLLLAGSLQSGAMPDEIVEQFVTGALPRAQGSPVVDDWDCLRGMVEAWSSGANAAACSPLMDQYGMQYTRTFANLCNSGVTVAMMQQALAPVCARPMPKLLPATALA